MDSSLIKEFNFPENIRDLDYKVFPEYLESDEGTLFHGTSHAAFEAICLEGFKAKRSLSSVSFARQSSLALGYACDSDENGVVLAVRFLSPRGIRPETSIVYLDDLSNQPEIVGYCNVPITYKHI